MTGEKKVLVCVLVVSIALWLGLAGAAIWHVQNDGIGWAWFFGIISFAPAAVVYEILRRWNRG